MITPENNGINHELLAKYLAGETSNAESEKVEEWLAASDENMAEFDRLSAIWNGAETPAMAFNSEKAWERMEGRIETEAQAKTQGSNGFRRYVLPMAAALIGAILLTLAYRNFLTGEDVQQLVASAETEVMELKLADGSVVHLNQGATLNYPSAFEADTRTVLMEGEAFFEVARNTEKPFEISVNRTKVSVLGTSFNIRSNEKGVVVTVSTGKVAFESSADAAQRVILEAGDQAIYEAASGIITTRRPATDLLFWKDRTLRYDATPLAEVVQQLSRNYGEEVVLADSALYLCPLSTTFERMELKQILDILSSTFKLEIDTVSNQIILHGEGCN